MKKIELAISIIQFLIDKHDDGDSLITEKDLINYSQTKNLFTSSSDDITECIKFINSSVNKEVIKEKWINVQGILSSNYETAYYTDYSVSGLSKILELLNRGLINDDDEFLISKIEEIILFQKKWSTLSFDEKQKIARESDRLNNIGAEYYNHDNFQEAINYFILATEIMPTNNDALKNLKICYKYTSEFDKMMIFSKLLSKL